MPRFAANLSMLYPEFDFLDRFDAAAKDGFAGVEYLFPYAFPAAEIAARLQANGLKQVLFNGPPGDWDGGERGLACLPGRESEFRDGIAKALDYAAALDCPRVHVMAGIIPADASDTERTRRRRTYLRNLRFACEEAQPQGVTVMIEPINPRDIPGYFLTTQAEAHAIREEVGMPNLKVQMDLYHAQIVEGDLSEKIRRYLPQVGHVQIAGVPGRHEPDVGEINYAFLFRLLDELKYTGYIGCEYHPERSTVEGLAWMYKLIDRPPAR